MMKTLCSHAFIFTLAIFISVKSYSQSIVPLLQTGHSKKITCMALSPDGKYLATGSDDYTLKVWNISTGQIIKSYEGHFGSVTSVNFSADGYYIISGSKDQMIRVWEFIRNHDNKILDVKYEFIQQQALRTNAMTEDQITAKYEAALADNYGCLQTYKGHKASIVSLGIASPFKSFVSLGNDNTIRFWDPLKDKEIASTPSNNAGYLCLSVDGSKYYTIEDDGTVSVYKYSTREKTGTLPEATSMVVLKASNDKKWIGGIDESGTISIWETSKHTKAATLPGHNPTTEITFLTGKTSVVFGSEKGLIEYDFKTKTVVKTFALPSQIAGSLVVTNDNQFACGISNEKDLYIIDIKTGIVKFDLPSINTNYNFNIINTEGSKTFSLDYSTNTLVSIEVFTGKIQQITLPAQATGLSLSKDNSTVIAYGESTIMQLNAEDLKLQGSFSINRSVDKTSGPVNDVLLVQDGNKISSYSLKTKQEKKIPLEEDIQEAKIINENHIAVLDANGGYTLFDSDKGAKKFESFNIASTTSDINSVKNLVAVCNTKNNIEIWNSLTKKKLKEIQTGMKAAIYQLQFSNNGLHLAALFEDGRIKLFEVETGYEIARRLEMKKNSKINPIAFTPNDKFIFCASIKNKLILWNWKEDKDIQILQGKNGAAIFSYDFNYIVSNKGVDLIAFKKGNEFYTFEQFDLHYNRPDKVLQTLGYADENLIKAYRQAYNKRLKKLGFKNSFQGIGIHIPEITVENSHEIATTTKTDKVVFKIKANDTDYLLRSILISVNGVPEKGVKGYEISDKKLKEYEGTFEVTLSAGINYIKIWCMNEKGAESYKKNIQIICDKPVEKPTLYVAVIGVSNYQNPSLNLHYAAKDGRDLIRTLTSQRDRYKEIIIDSLLNEEATLEKITAIKKRFLQSNVDDRVIVFFAGHGLLDNNLDYYLATHDVDFNNPSVKGLAYEKLEELLDGIPARNKLLLMDACHSGEVDKDEVQINVQQTKTQEEDLTFRAVPGSTAVKTIGLNNSFEMMKQLFSDLRKGNGTTVISSAGGAEYAMEGDNWKNGVFTYCMLTALTEKKADTNSDNKITLTELQEYLQIHVAELTDGKQKPTSRVENISNDWQIW